MEVKVTRNKAVADALDALIAGGKLIGKIGWTANDIHTDPQTGRSQPIAKTALLNEFGYVNILNDKFVMVPARPFLRNTIARESDNWLEMMEDGSKQVLNGTYGFDKVLDNTTGKAVNDVRDTVRSRVSPPLAPYTLKQRLTNSILRGGPLSSGTLPLYDTGHMMQTLTNEVIPA